MRTINITITSPESVSYSPSQNAGIMGEHLETQLVISLPETITADYFYLIFNSIESTEQPRSEEQLHAVNGVITYLLPQSVTSLGREIKWQLWGYRLDGTVIVNIGKVRSQLLTLSPSLKTNTTVTPQQLSAVDTEIAKLEGTNNSITEAEALRVTAENERNVFEPYIPEKPYKVGNKVSYEGSSYYCKVDSTGNLPTDTVYWLLIASKGDKGDKGDIGVANIDDTAPAVDKVYSSNKVETVKSEIDSNIKTLKTIYGDRYVRALGNLLTEGIEPACILCVGDSTGNDSNEWFYTTMQWLALQYPKYTFKGRYWVDATQSYSNIGYPISNGSDGEAYALMTGTANSNITTPHKTSLAISGDIDVAIKLSMDNWSEAKARGLVSKLGNSAPNRSWAFMLDATNKPYFWWSANGTDLIVATSTLALSVANGSAIWVRATLDVDNGAGGYTAKFYTSTNGFTWTQLGGDVTGTGVTGIYNNTVNLEIGSRSAITASMWIGKIYHARLKNGIDGKIVASFDASLAFPSIVTTCKDAEANVWTINGDVTVGHGSPGVLVLNGSCAGKGISYTTDANRFELQAAYEPNLVFINYSHNEEGNIAYQSTYEGLCTQFKTKYPNIGIVCCTQNPEASPAINIIPHAIRNRQIAMLAAKNNYGLIDAFRMFTLREDLRNLLDSGGIHPTQEGSALWKDLAVSYLQAAVN